MSKKNHTALEVAEAILYKCNERKITDVSNKKLQKLLYYVQAWNLVLNGDKIFNEPIEAWVHGPAIKTIYREYKSFNWGTISIELKSNVLDAFSKNELKVLDEVLDAYGEFDASYLEALTHSEDPWKNARKGLDSDVGTDKEIATDAMRKYYSSLIA